MVEKIVATLNTFAGVEIVDIDTESGEVAFSVTSGRLSPVLYMAEATDAAVFVYTSGVGAPTDIIEALKLALASSIA